MKKYLLLLATISLFCCISCEEELIEISDSSNYVTEESATEAAATYPECDLHYKFKGKANDNSGNPILDPNTGENTFLFWWNFDPLLCIAGTTFEVKLEFRSHTSLSCMGHSGSNNSFYSHTTNLTSISGVQQYYFNPIGFGMIADKMFEYRTVITLHGCGDSPCTTVGPWKGPLCSHMW